MLLLDKTILSRAWHQSVSMPQPSGWGFALSSTHRKHERTQRYRVSVPCRRVSLAFRAQETAAHYVQVQVGNRHCGVFTHIKGQSAATLFEPLLAGNLRSDHEQPAQ